MRWKDDGEGTCLLTLLPGRLGGATVDQGVEVVMGVSNRGTSQKNSEELHIEDMS